MSTEAFSPEQIAWLALVENTKMRTGCAPEAIVNLLFEGGVTPDDKDLLEAEVFERIALDVVIYADGDGLPCNHCIAERSLIDLAWINAMRGKRLGDEGSELQKVIARVAFQVGESPSAARHALAASNLLAAEGSSEEVMARAERLALVRFLAETDTRH